MKQHTVVCSLHFTDSDLEKSGFAGRWYVKPGCFPSIFKCWEHKPYLMPSNNKRRKLNKLQLSKKDYLSDTSTCNDFTLDTDIDDVKQCVNELNGDASATTNFEATYTSSNSAENYENEIASLRAQIDQLKGDLENAESTIRQLQETVSSTKFCIENINDKDIPFFTGFPSKEVFHAVLTYLNPGPNGENLVYIRQESKPDVSSMSDRKIGRPRKLSPEDQFLLYLCRVRLGLFECDLAYRFNISVATVSNIVLSWTNYMYLRLGSLNIWPSRDKVNQTMPETFKPKYNDTRIIIDCTEIKVEMASSLVLKSQTYSNYKSTNTLKGLVGIAPNGNITFLSQLYTGSISDREITERCGILKMQFEKDDLIMADKGFDIQDLLDPLDVYVNTPPFLHMQDQMSSEDVLETQEIAAQRIHVERAINKIKNFHIFDRVIPLSLAVAL